MPRISAAFAPFRRISLALAALLAAASTQPAAADGRFKADYRVTLAGLPIGSGTLIADIAGNSYRMTATGRSGGLFGIFGGGDGDATASGAIRGDRVLPDKFAIAIRTRAKATAVSMGIAGGAVRNLSIDPPDEPKDIKETHVPLTEAHKRGVLDPFSAGLVPRGGTEGFGPAPCKGRIPVFDGRHRFDLSGSLKRTVQLQAEHGYSGPAIVCSVTYTPIAGYDSNRAAIKWLREQRDIEVWLVPLAGTRFLGVFRISVPTRIGAVVLQATRFEAVSTSKRTEVTTQGRP